MNVMVSLKSLSEKSEKLLDREVPGIYFLYTNAQQVSNKQDECELQI